MTIFSQILLSRAPLLRIEELTKKNAGLLYVHQKCVIKEVCLEHVRTMFFSVN